MKRTISYYGIILLIFFSNIFASCDVSSQGNFASKQDRIDTFKSKQAIKVDVDTVKLSTLLYAQQYKGTTQPQREVSWRSQIEGTLLELLVEVGDGVERGQLIGRLDNSLLLTDVAGKVGELAALQSELAQTKIQVTNAKIKLDEAKIQLQQAKSEAIRYQDLAKTGLIAQQQAESFKTAAEIAEKSLLTAQEAVKLEEKAVAIAEGRIVAQQAAIAESKQRQSYSKITAPISGVAIAKAKEPGSLIRIGEEVVTIGDFSQIKVVVPLSELDLDKVSVGQHVEVKLDAFGDRKFMGKVSRIAPTTNSSSRQIPIEVMVNNPDRKIKGGLLARVNFTPERESSIIILETAIVEDRGDNYVFTVTKQDNKKGNVTKQKVIVGDRNNGKVEIIAGLSPGDRYVLRSSKPLEDKDSVSLSIISK